MILEWPIMIKRVKILLLASLVFTLALGTFIYGRSGESKIDRATIPYKRLKLKADSAYAYCQQNGLNVHYCFLVDFSIHSGKKRFFVWDFKGDSIKHASLCAHGYGKKSTVTQPVYSNVEGSSCSSLGRYKVGIRSHSKWGIHVHYKLHGLEPTNNNAYKRYVVLHSFTPVPKAEIHPVHLPLGMSQGCPVICNKTMTQIDALLKAEKKPVLMWIYN